MYCLVHSCQIIIESFFFLICSRDWGGAKHGMLVRKIDLVAHTAMTARSGLCFTYAPYGSEGSFGSIVF